MGDLQENSKREVPLALKKVLEADVYFTEKFVLWANQLLPLRSLRNHYRALEVSNNLYGSVILRKQFLDYMSWDSLVCFLARLYVAVQQ